jgi:hypothetical protein
MDGKLAAAAFAAVLGVLAPSVGRAQAAVSDAAGTQSTNTPAEFDDWTLTLQIENEFLIPGRNDDRYYTQGIQLNLLTPSKNIPLKELLLGLGKPGGAKFLDRTTNVRGSFVLGQNIYTPEDLTLLEPDPNDRPYAGWIYVGAEVLTYDDGDGKGPGHLNALQLQVGTVGPRALGGWAQNNWHKHVNHIAEAQGWRHQLRNEVAFVLYGESRRRWSLVSSDQVGVDFIDNVNFALGTVQTSIGGGGMLRVGTRLDEDFGPPRIRPAPVGSSFFRKPDGLAWYVYAGADLKAVGRDIFLDGNTFRDSRRVDKRWVVSEMQAGAVLRYELVRLTYSHVWRSEEFLGQRGPSHFGALTIGAYFPLTSGKP